MSQDVTEKLDTAVAVSRTVSNTTATDTCPTPLDVCRMLIKWDDDPWGGNICDVTFAARRAVAHYEQQQADALGYAQVINGDHPTLPADFVAPIRGHEPETHSVQLSECKTCRPTHPTLSDAVGVEDDPFATR